MKNYGLIADCMESERLQKPLNLSLIVDTRLLLTDFSCIFHRKNRFLKTCRMRNLSRFFFSANIIEVL
jgi:hypothetical protein